MSPLRCITPGPQPINARPPRADDHHPGTSRRFDQMPPRLESGFAAITGMRLTGIDAGADYYQALVANALFCRGAWAVSLVPMDVDLTSSMSVRGTSSGEPSCRSPDVR